MSRKKRVVVSVINDLVSDQRVHRTCQTLHESGFEVMLVGRVLPNSLPINRVYSCKRMKLMFTKGALFYAEYNLRLFFLLLYTKYNVLHSNDLDTLLANYLVKRIKGGELVYDSHEYFTEVPELVNRPSVQNIWLKIEQFVFPKLKNVYTVNSSIAEIYQSKYSKNVGVVRNVPVLNTSETEPVKKSNYSILENSKVILVQGAGINVDRGIEEMVLAMQFIEGAVFLIVGSGDVILELKRIVEEKALQNKVLFTGKVPFEELQKITKIADWGVSLDKDTNLNYKYSLPNKLFDYLHADIPVFASNLVEVKKVIDEFSVGIVLSSHDPEIMANEISKVLFDDSKSEFFKENCKKAKTILNWDREKQVLLDIYKSI